MYIFVFDQLQMLKVVRPEEWSEEIAKALASSCFGKYPPFFLFLAHSFSLHHHWNVLYALHMGRFIFRSQFTFPITLPRLGAKGSLPQLSSALKKSLKYLFLINSHTVCLLYPLSLFLYLFLSYSVSCFNLSQVW